jgi:LacI family transcriptional regulator
MEVTIEDVAERAGCSVSTVSRVVNHTSYVTPELTERVWAAVEELDYRPSAIARSLRGKHTRTLGMIVPDSSNPFFAEISWGIEDVCFKRGYSVILCNSDQDSAKERAYIDMLTEKWADGIVFVAAGSHADYLQAVSQKKAPVVVVDRELEAIECDCVLTDNWSGGQQATDHLIEQGHERIACITGPSDVTPSRDRVHGYEGALTAAGLEVRTEFIRRGDFHPPSGYCLARELLSLPRPPTAIFACNDLMALGVIRAANELGLSIPQEVAIVGFDNIALASYSSPPLTTVAQQTRYMGQLAARLLIDRIDNRKRPPKRHVLETKLVVRQSSSER